MLKLDQHTVVGRANRRRLLRHAHALRAASDEARRALEGEDLDAERREALRRAVARLDGEVARMEQRIADAGAGREAPGEAFYDGSARD